MRQEVLNLKENNVDTKDISLDGFVVKETLADHLVESNEPKNEVLSSAGLRTIQGRKRGATMGIYNRYLRYY